MDKLHGFVITIIRTTGLEAELGRGLTPFARMYVDCVHGDNDLEADGLELLETISR